MAHEEVEFNRRRVCASSNFFCDPFLLWVTFVSPVKPRKIALRLIDVMYNRRHHVSVCHHVNISQMEKPLPNPASSPPAEDVGADTQRRFRHQACYIAILSLGLLDDEGPLRELYCEHHDDVILQMKSGSFKAVQLKTRLVGGVPFKSGDAEIVGALRRFVTLEAKFPGRFESYLLASNVGFWHEKKNGSNLDYVLSELRIGSGKFCGALVKKIAEMEPAIDSAIASNALRKVQLGVTPGLDDVEPKLREQLAQISEFSVRRYDELKAASDSLRDRIFEASSLAGLSALPEYLAVCSDSLQSLQDQNVIKLKRIDKTIVSEVLNRELSSETLLRTHQLVPIVDLPKGMNRMEIKMTAGGLSVREIDHLKDLKFSTEYLLQQWLYIYGNEQAQKYYEHLRVVVRGACLAAQEKSQQPEGFYASKMLSDLRQRLEHHFTTIAVDTPECRQDHLLGMAGILTEDCKVWWSAEFELPEEST